MTGHERDDRNDDQDERERDHDERDHGKDSRWEDDSRGAGEADTKTPSEGGADKTDDPDQYGGERADQT
jgi:hypothetical protein